MARPGLAGRGRRLGDRPDGRGWALRRTGRRRAARLPVVDGHRGRHRRPGRCGSRRTRSACATRHASTRCCSGVAPGTSSPRSHSTSIAAGCCSPTAVRPCARSRERAPTSPLWERMLVEYAQLQRALEPYVDELLGRGRPRSRAGRAAGGPRRLLDDARPAAGRRRDGLTDDRAGGSARVRAGVRRLRRAGCLRHRAVPAARRPARRQRVRAARPGGPLRVFDWGDAVVGHPFGDAARQPAGGHRPRGPRAGAAELLRLRDAYLEPWTGDHDRADLVEAAGWRCGSAGWRAPTATGGRTLEWHGPPAAVRRRSAGLAEGAARPDARSNPIS